MGHRITEPPDAYRYAPSGLGPLAAEWADKPHRLVYDLVAEVEILNAKVALLDEQCSALLAASYTVDMRHRDELRSLARLANDEMLYTWSHFDPEKLVSMAGPVGELARWLSSHRSLLEVGS